jgi:hypothetical protein
MMRFIPTRTHGALDYIIGVVLIVFPFVAGLVDRGPTEWGTTALGFGLIVYSLFTDYELGAVRLIPLKVHLLLDAAGGAALIVLAMLFAPVPAARVFLVLVGIIEIGSFLLTRTATSDSAGELSPSIRTVGRHQGKVATPSPAGPQTSDGRPDYPVQTGPKHTVEQLRGAIDSGRTGDKVAVVDPAAAPLGSDDEAAQGHDEEGLATARRQSRRRQG